MKTPMQEVIEQLREQAQLIAPDDCVQDKFYKKGLLNAIKYAETMLEKSQKLQQGMLDTITDLEARVKDLEEVFVLSIEEIKKRKENIIDNGKKIPQPMLEGGVMAFDASIDAIKETLKQVLEK